MKDLQGSKDQISLGRILGNSKVYKILQLKFYTFVSINTFYKHSNNIEFVRPNLSPNKFGPSKP